MKLEKLVLLSAFPTARWSSGGVGVMACAAREGGIPFPGLLCSLWARTGTRRCSGLLGE